MAVIPVQDGPFTRGAHEGEDVLIQDPAAGGPFIYFELDDAFAQPYQLGLIEKALVTAEVWAPENESMGFRIQYDSQMESSYYETENQWTEAGEAGWKTVSFVLEKPYFGHSQNGGADFRLVNHNDKAWVRGIKVEKILAEPSAE
jgi:hypothetical protein